MLNIKLKISLTYLFSAGWEIHGWVLGISSGSYLLNYGCIFYLVNVKPGIFFFFNQSICS